MKEDRNTSQNVEEFGIKQANIVGYVEGIEDIWQELETIRSDLIEQKDIAHVPTSPGNAYYLGVIEMEQKTLELCRLRITEAHQAQLELCEEVRRRTKRNDS